MESNEEINDGGKEIFIPVELGQKIRTNVSNSKQRLANDQVKGKTNSKLPRVVRPPVESKLCKGIEHFKNFDDKSGDTLPGPSKMGGFPVKMKKDSSKTADKLKLSHIPRRKCNKEDYKETCELPKKTETPNNNQFIPECRNVQRIQMLLNQDFGPEDREPPPASVQSTRPIPTLGQIYGRINMIDSGRLNDWFMEFVPINSTPINPSAASCDATNDDDDGASSTVTSPANCHQPNLTRATMILEKNNNIINGLHSAKENVTVWLSSDVEYPTRNTESGYKTMSSKHVEKSFVSSQSECEMEKSNLPVSLGVLPDNKSNLLGTTKLESDRSDGPSVLLKEQQTVVLCVSPEAENLKAAESTSTIPKTDITIKLAQMPKPDSTRNTQPSCHCQHNTTTNVNHAAVTSNVPVPSYTECLSEILQKTTNFEMMDAIAVENEKTSSNSAITHTDDNLSNEETIQGESLDKFDDENLPNLDWGPLQDQTHSNLMMIKSDASEDYESTESPNHDSWFVKNDFHGRPSYCSCSPQDMCPECHRYNRFPSSRFKKLRSPFGSWRHRISIRRICRRRWNHVWKKTAERWGAWSVRSPMRFNKIRPMQNFKPGVISEDADVQTYTPMYNETGTDSVLKELNSAVIGTPFNMESLANMSQHNESTSKSISINRVKFKHSSLGPSMYPFLHDAQEKSLPAKPIKIRDDKEKCHVDTHPLYQDNCNSAINNININEFPWRTHKIDSTKSCQYEDTRELPENVEQSTSFTEMNDVSLSEQNTDTLDLRYFMYDKVTSTCMKTNPYRMSIEISKDAFTQKIIMCHNAETDVSFLPVFNHSSTGTITSICDITYYKPYAGSEVTELNENKTHQSICPGLRKLQSRSVCARSLNDISEIDTQMTPVSSIDKVATGMSTSKQKLSEKTTSFAKDILILHEETELIEEQKPELSSQTEEIKPEPTTDNETQMSPAVSITTVSTNVTPRPSTFEEQSTPQNFMKESFAVQTVTINAKNLALTGPKIMSISSRELCPTSHSTETMNEEKQAVACNVSFRQNCTCTPLSVVTCGTDVKFTDLYCNKETSAEAMDSYYETQLLLNNLIKKALMGKSDHSQLSDASDMIRNQRLCFVTTSTSTHVGLETKSIGPTMSEVTELIGICKTEIGIQYLGCNVETEVEKEKILDGSEKSEDVPCVNNADQGQMTSKCMLIQTTSDLPTQTEFYGPHKSATIMTSYYGQTQSIQFPPASVYKVETVTNPEIIESTEENPATNSSHLSIESQTNTETNLTDLKSVHSAQKSVVLRQSVKSSFNTLSKPKNSKVRSEDEIKKQITSLSRLMARKRRSSTISTPLLAQFSTPFCSEITNQNWMKECHSVKKACQKLLIPDEEEILKDKVSIEPLTSLSKDSLEDVLPINGSKKVCASKNNVQITVNPAMVDEVTSDENVTKDVKESILQACPDICDTGTESVLETQKSACVLTTQCILPSPCPCTGLLSEHGSNDECVFVYGEPYCTIHSKNNATVQMTSKDDSDHSVGMLTSLAALRTMRSERKSSVHIREVLSPKVYKALYETTKLVVSDSKKPNSRKSVEVFSVDAEVEAAKLPDVRSAGVVTTGKRGSSLLRKKSSSQDRRTPAHNECTLYRVANTDIPDMSLAHSNILNSAEENNGSKEDSSYFDIDESLKTNLLTSCRYYSDLLTKQLGRVKNNLAKHLAQSLEEESAQTSCIPVYATVNACTMKPSGRAAFASQTLQYSHYYKPPKHMSCCILSPATSLTDICKHDKNNLKSVYYMLSAIEGRLRRLKLSTHDVSVANRCRCKFEVANAHVSN